jgi:hypothetical protein
MENFFGFLGAYYLIPSLIIGFIGFLLGWFLKPSTKQAGDLSVEGEGALRAEADSLRARVQDLEGRLAGRDSEVSDLKSQLSAAAPAASADVTTKTTDSDETYALEWQNRYLAARVKYLDSRLAELGGDTSDAKAAPKKSAAKKAAPKKSTAKKASAATATAAPVKKAAAKSKPPAKKAAPKKATTKKAATKSTSAKSTAAKSTAKKSTAKKSGTDYDKYYEKVKAFDARASKAVVKNIVDYCGISLRSRDSSLVACSDESELKTVADGFVTKKLGLEDGQMELVKSVCEQMKGTRLKSRVTFYYLAAKKAKKLSIFK